MISGHIIILAALAVTCVCSCTLAIRGAPILAFALALIGLWLCALMVRA